VSDGNDIDEILCNRVHNREWKSAKHEMPQCAVEPRPQFRVVERQMNDSLNLSRKVTAEVRQLES